MNTYTFVTTNRNKINFIKRLKISDLHKTYIEVLYKNLVPYKTKNTILAVDNKSTQDKCIVYISRKYITLSSYTNFGIKSGDPELVKNFKTILKKKIKIPNEYSEKIKIDDLFNSRKFIIKLFINKPGIKKDYKLSEKISQKVLQLQKTIPNKMNIEDFKEFFENSEKKLFLYGLSGLKQAIAFYKKYSKEYNFIWVDPSLKKVPKNDEKKLYLYIKKIFQSSYIKKKLKNINNFCNADLYAYKKGNNSLEKIVQKIESCLPKTSAEKISTNTLKKVLDDFSKDKELIPISLKYVSEKDTTARITEYKTTDKNDKDYLFNTELLKFSPNSAELYIRIHNGFSQRAKIISHSPSKNSKKVYIELREVHQNIPGLETLVFPKEYKGGAKSDGSLPVHMINLIMGYNKKALAWYNGNSQNKKKVKIDKKFLEQMNDKDIKEENKHLDMFNKMITLLYIFSNDNLRKIQILIYKSIYNTRFYNINYVKIY